MVWGIIAWPTGVKPVSVVSKGLPNWVDGYETRRYSEGATLSRRV